MSDFFTEEEKKILFKPRKASKNVKSIVNEVSYKAVVNFSEGKLISSKYVFSLILPFNVITIMDHKYSLNIDSIIDLSAFKGVNAFPEYASIKDLIVKNTKKIDNIEGVGKNLFSLLSIDGIVYGGRLDNPVPASIYLIDGRIFLNQDIDDNVLPLHSYNALKIFLSRKQLK